MECQKKVSKWLDVKTACRTKMDITDDKIWKGHMKTHVYTIFEGKFQVKMTTHHSGAKSFCNTFEDFVQESSKTFLNQSYCSFHE